MSPAAGLILSGVAAYLLGSLNFGIIVSRVFTGVDLRTKGSGNAGTTNALRVLGPKLALLVLLGDALKGLLAAWIGLCLCGANGTLLASACAFLGHVFPVFFKFKGGKGVLTTAAALSVFDWRVVATALLIFVAIVVLTRYVSLGSVLAAASIPLLFLAFRDGTAAVLTGLVLGGSIIFLHRGNISRLLNGTERTISFKKQQKAQE